MLRPRARCGCAALPRRLGAVPRLRARRAGGADAAPAGPPGRLPVAPRCSCPAAILRDRDSGRCWRVARRATSVARPRLEAAWSARASRCRAAARADAPLSAWLRRRCRGFSLDGVARCTSTCAPATCSRSICRAAGGPGSRRRLIPPRFTRPLRQANPAPFAGLLAARRLRGQFVAGAAGVGPRPRMETRPIAGTRPRFAGDDDAARIASWWRTRRSAPST